MNGKRPDNKTIRTYNSSLDDHETRNYFKHMCADNGYRIVQLEAGENELQMYKTCEMHSSLNVFLTRDSDMLSILYGHRPSIVFRHDTNRPYTNFTTDSTPVTNQSNIVDTNDTYDTLLDCRIFDSCAWAICDLYKNGIRTNITMLGFDFSAERFGYNTLVWRAYCALCGTDFTRAQLTTSMLTSAIQNMRAEERDLINTRNDELETHQLLEIVVAFFLAASRSGSLKKATRPLDVNVDSFYKWTEKLTTTIRLYYTYITCGVMPHKEIPQIDDPYNCFMNIMYACRGKRTQAFEKKALKQGSQRVNLDTCLENLRHYCTASSIVPSTIDSDQHEVYLTINHYIMKREYEHAVDNYITSDNL